MQPGDTGQAYPQTCGGKYMSKMNTPVWYGVSSGPLCAAMKPVR